MTPINPKRKLWSNVALLAGLSVLLCVAAWCGYQIDQSAHRQQKLKEDYSAANSITFGIFSVDSWRDQITNVTDSTVRDFKLTPQQKHDLQKSVEKQLHDLVSKTADEINKPQKGLGNKLKKMAFNALVDVDSIQALVPSFAHTIVAHLTSHSSTQRLKGIVKGKLHQLEQQTYDSTAEAHATLTAYMYKKYNVQSDSALNKFIDSQVQVVHKATYNYTYGLLGCVVFALALWWLLRNQVHMQTSLFIVSLLLAFVVLLIGVNAPIIEVDARISTMHFTLLNQQVGFSNQVLFFQSKSLMGVVTTLMAQQKPDAVVVGALIFLFVIVLPVLMLIATGFYLGGSKIANSKVIRYMAFEAGKWNMADVMVVGIIMTYIGLNGILKSQLSGLNMQGGGLTLITVNNTYLQPGYFVFVGYVLYETILQRILKRRNEPPKAKNNAQL